MSEGARVVLFWVLAAIVVLAWVGLVVALKSWKDKWPNVAVMLRPGASPRWVVFWLWSGAGLVLAIELLMLLYDSLL